MCGQRCDAPIERAICQKAATVISVREGMQRGRASDSFDGGWFSPTMDGGVHCFHKWIAKYMSSAGAAAT
jgi:hypothetical protein